MNYGQQPNNILSFSVKISRYELNLALNLEICDVIKGLRTHDNTALALADTDFQVHPEFEGTENSSPAEY
ncbi:hypothetical protein BGX21_006473 [Mortierella sp. AD011]|nr:hypothetical protein BGX21_006473 [Mortierella sp. AD011]